MADNAEHLREQIAEKERQIACLQLDAHAQAQNRLYLKVMQNQLVLAKVAWWRGKKAACHSIRWYAVGLARYSELERAAFMAGYNGLPYLE